MVTMPVPHGFHVTSGFGPRAGGYHWGTDYGRGGGSAGYPIYAVKDGTVTRSGPASGFGRWITIDHPASNGGGETVYGHIIPEVSVGQKVSEGQRIGRIDPSPATNGGVAPHLHFEWHRYSWAPPGNNRLNPEVMLKGASWPGETTKPAIPTTKSILYGVDISNHQKGIDISRIASEGFKFCILKATEGTWKDPYFKGFLRQVKQTTMYPAAYVYVRHEKSGREHAQALHEQLEGDTSVPVALDIELNSGRDVNHWKSIRDEIEKLGYRVFLTYLPHWYWKGHAGSPNVEGLPPLWTSNYGGGNGYASVIYSAIGHRRGFDGYGGLGVRIWQFTDKAQVAGYKIDANVFEGTEAQLKELFTGIKEEGLFVSLSKERQEDLAHKVDVIYDFLTDKRQSRYEDAEGNRSGYSADLGVYIEEQDKKIENIHADILPWMVETLQEIRNRGEQVA